MSAEAELATISDQADHSKVVTVCLAVAGGLAFYALVMVLVIRLLRRGCKKRADAKSPKTITVLKRENMSPPSSSSPSASECEVHLDIEKQPDTLPQPLLAQQQHSHEGPHSPKQLQLLLHEKLQQSRSRTGRQLQEQPQAPLQQAQAQAQSNVPRGMASAWLARQEELDARGSESGSEIGRAPSFETACGSLTSRPAVPLSAVQFTSPNFASHARSSSRASNSRTPGSSDGSTPKTPNSGSERARAFNEQLMSI